MTGNTKPPGSNPEQRAWVLGGLIGLVFTVGMLQVWWHWHPWGWVWAGILMFFGPFLLRLPMWPRLRMVMIALYVGTFLSMMLQEALAREGAAALPRDAAPVVTSALPNSRIG